MNLRENNGKIVSMESGLRQSVSNAEILTKNNDLQYFTQFGHMAKLGESTF
jgi:hypothetical protein